MPSLCYPSVLWGCWLGDRNGILHSGLWKKILLRKFPKLLPGRTRPHHCHHQWQLPCLSITISTVSHQLCQSHARFSMVFRPMLTTNIYLSSTFVLSSAGPYLPDWAESGVIFGKKLWQWNKTKSKSFTLSLRSGVVLKFTPCPEFLQMSWNFWAHL